MNTENRYKWLWVFLVSLAFVFSFFGTAFAVDDGARAYWKGREGTQAISFQYFNLNMQASGSQQFDPGQFIYPNTDAEADVISASWARHMTVFNRPSSLAVNLIGGSVDADISTGPIPVEFLPSGVIPGSTFTQSASGIADPTIQFDMNLFGTPRLKSNVDLLNYEPDFTIDAAVMIGLPIGNYDNDKLVNLGQNRWFSRLALPMKYHFGAFSPGYMNSIEVTPSVWIFDDNDDFIGQKLENDPMWQIEAHLTHDFTRSLFGSIDLLYRSGFQTQINGIEKGSELDIGNIGFTLNYHATDNLAIRTGFSTNAFGDDDLDNSLIRIQFVYMWQKDMENFKKLTKDRL
jgi:hypothetical protein